jgi:CRP/FNR family transcriptional regulator, cyclic AMP receptor protein
MLKRNQILAKSKLKRSFMMNEVKCGSVNLTKRVSAWTDGMIQRAPQSPSPAAAARFHASWTDGMIQQAPHSDQFKEQMQGSLLNEIKNSSAIKVDKHNHVYTVGDERATVYFIEKGQIKLVMVSSEGKECMLAIHGAGDVFGELCLSGLGGRLETATAMEDTLLKEIPCGKFLGRLAKDSLLEGFIKYLAVRVADQQQVIANLVTVDSEQRLGKALLQIARKLGRKDPRSVRIEVRLSHEELGTMVGTTRPRISVFMQRFRNLDLIEYNTEHHLIIKEHKLTAYLASIL